MKLRVFAIAGLATICLQAYAANTASNSNNSLNNQLSTTANNGSAVFGTNANNTNNTPATTMVATNNAACNTPVTLTTDADKISYALGVDIGRNFKNQNLQINSAAMAKGIDDGYAGGTTMMTPKDMQATLISFQQQLMTKHQQQMTQLSAQNKQAGDAFLASNKTKPGVQTLPDGLQYQIIKPGSGTSPTDQDSVTVNYVGTFINGQVFDSSYSHGQPLTFHVTDVIPGWTEALKMMKPGAVWQIYIPSNLAYGDHGMPPVIGPNETLIFKVELISVSPAGATSAPSNNPAQNAGQ